VDYRRLNEDEVGFYDQQIFHDTGRRVRPIDVVDGDLVVDNRFYAARRNQIRALQQAQGQGVRKPELRNARPRNMDGSTRPLRGG